MYTKFNTESLQKETIEPRQFEANFPVVVNHMHLHVVTLQFTTQENEWTNWQFQLAGNPQQGHENCPA